MKSVWAKLDGDSNALYAEAFCHFVSALAIIISRGQNGEVARYPVVEAVNRDHICHITKTPAQIAPEIAQAAMQIVERAAMMVNLLGYADGTGTAYGLAGALRIPGTHVHVYGKTHSARGRKMGHVTALGNTMDEALATAQRAADCIRFGGDE